MLLMSFGPANVLCFGLFSVSLGLIFFWPSRRRAAVRLKIALKVVRRSRDELWPVPTTPSIPLIKIPASQAGARNSKNFPVRNS